MEPPVIHYDLAMGVEPKWRSIITQALKGDFLNFNAERAFTARVSFATCRILESLYAYAASGQQVFCVGPRLQQMLNDTKCGQVPREAFRLPYDGFYIALPECPWQLYGDVTGMHQAGGIYVSHDSSDGEILFTMWGKDNERSRHVLDDATFWVHLILDDIPQTTAEDGTVLFDFETFVRQMLDGYKQNASDPQLEIPPGKYEESIRDIPNLMRVTVNLILYLNSTNAETVKYRQPKRKPKPKPKVKMTKKMRRKRQANRVQSEAAIVWVGKSAESTPVRRQGGGTGKGRGTWSCRRGHFHRYWVGRRKNDDGTWRRNAAGRVVGERQVVKWVAPVYRDMASIIASRGRHYRFQEERKDYDGETN